jgi:putative chitinase
MKKSRETQLMRDAMSAGIKSPRELANFMAQVTHESGDLKWLEESFRYTRSIDQIPVRSARREGLEALEAARTEALRGNPEKLGDLMYGGRMGNTEPGDGYRYRGRGYMQLTGKNGYRAAGDALGLDLVNHPDLAADPGNASKIAAWYWIENVQNVAPENVAGATRIINGGTNGLQDRQERFAEWEKKLTPEFIQALDPMKSLSGIAIRLDDPAHAEHAMFKQAQVGVYRMDAKAGRAPDDRSNNLAAALVVAARSDGLDRIDHVSLSTDASKVFAVKGDLNSPFRQVSSVPTVESLDTSIAQSTQAWEKASQPAVAQKQQLAHQVTSPDRTQASLAHGH